MKKIHSILLLITGIFFLSACEEELRDPVLVLEGGPAITSPSAVKSYLLSEETAGNVMETFKWSAAKFGFPAAVTYTLQFAEANKNFAAPINVVSTSNLTFALKVSELNERLLALNVPAGALFQMEGRVKASVGESAPEQFSPVFKFSVVPYESKLPPIYLLGDATLNEWDNNKAQPMPFWSTNVYGIVTPLKANKNIKVIKTLGAWAPQWGQASGTWDAGKLAYRPTESVADPSAIPSPPTEGDYLVSVNIETLNYSVTKMPAAVYLVGDGSNAGLDPAKGIAFTKESVGVYTLTTALKNSGGLKILYSTSGWAPQWGTSAGAISAVGKLAFRPNEGTADPASIPAPATAGNYKITLNFSENTYKIAQQ